MNSDRSRRKRDVKVVWGFKTESEGYDLRVMTYGWAALCFNF